MPVVRIRSGAGAGNVYEIGPEVLSIGRDESCRIQILDQGVSRQHAQIFRIGEMIFVRDLGSTNGTFLNNQRVAEEMLKAGDEVLIGTTLLTFEDEDASTRRVPQAVTEDTPATAATVELRIRPEAGPKPGGKEVSSRLVTLMDQISIAVGGASNLRQRVERILDSLVRLLGASHAYVLESDEGGRITTRAFAEAENYAGEKKVSRTVLRRVSETGRPLLTSDASADERLQLSESIVLKKIRSVICAPIDRDGGKQRFLYLHSDTDERPFAQQDLELGAAAAVQLAVLLASEARAGEADRELGHFVLLFLGLLDAAIPGLREHSRRVAAGAGAIAQQLSLPEARVRLAHRGALVHDVGRSIASGDAEHVHAGVKILEAHPEMAPLVPIVRYHHERADGSGFPLGAKNADLPVEARIVVVANAVDNLVRHDKLSLDDAVRAVCEERAAQFDADVLKGLAIVHRRGALSPESPAP